MLAIVRPGWQLNTTLCNCDRAETVGLMDVDIPSYCNKPAQREMEKTSNYDFYIAEEPHGQWTGYACWAWIHEKTIDGYFFGSYDTKERTSAVAVTKDECWMMANFLDCAGNKMKTDGEISYYKEFADGQGQWMQTKIYAVKQCEVRTITLSKDCPTCPVVSAFGPLTNDSELSYIVRHQVSIVWKPPKLQEKKPCSLKRIHTGAGHVSAMDEKLVKLTDAKDQLDFILQRKTVKMCDQKMHKLVNIERGFVKLETDYFQRWTTLQNAVSKLCLTNLTSPRQTTENCTQEETQRVEIGEDNIVRDYTTQQCFTLEPSAWGPTMLIMPTKIELCSSESKR